MANPRESELSYPWGETLPEPGGLLALEPGLAWVRMGLPFALDHINLWLLRDEIEGRQGWTLVDCGVANEATRGLWEQVLDKGLQGRPLLRVLVTHFHPDHLGLAAWLTERFSTPEQPCRLWMSAADYNLARIASSSTVGMGGEAAAAFFASHGLTDPEAQAKIRGRASYYPSMVPAVPASYRRLMPGQLVMIGGARWRCIGGYGHAPEHLSFFREDGPPVLISGDMLLPRISTNVSVVDVEPEANPLQLYLDSLAALLGLPADTLVLPSHGRPFRGVQARVAQLQAHHRERLDEVLQACAARPSHAAELLPLLFRRPLDLHQTTFAMGESIAHLNALWHEGRLRRERGSDGVLRFSA